MHPRPLLPGESRDHRPDNRRWLARDEDRVIVGIERRQLDAAILERSDPFHHVTLIRESSDDKIVDTRSRIELNQNHFTRTQYRSHAVTGDAQRDVSASRDV